jgi:hypothetical protein
MEVSVYGWLLCDILVSLCFSGSESLSRKDTKGSLRIILAAQVSTFFLLV